MLLVRGDHMGNEVKIGKLPGLGRWRWASDAEIVAATGCRPGYLGPVGIPADMPLIVDRTRRRDGRLRLRRQRGRLPPPRRQLRPRLPRARRASPTSATSSPATRRPTATGTLEILRGIEVGHVFALGTVYSKAMGATYLDADGQSQVIEMGCYGIGVTRVVAAAIEQNHDERGIIWPEPMAPFAVAIAPIGYDRSEAVRALADRLHDELAAAGVEVLLDDRGERPGVMFADLELIGIPHRITIGDRGLKDGKRRVPGPARQRRRRRSPVDEIAALHQGKARRVTIRRHRLIGCRAGRGRMRSRRSSRTPGAQAEEQLAPSVVAGLSRAIADKPVPADYGNRGDVRAWLAEMSRRLAPRVPDERERRELLATVHYEARRAGLDPQLVLGVIQVRERVPEVRDLDRRCPRLHAGDAVLDPAHRRAGPEPLQPAHQPALRLHDPAPLPRHRERRPLPRARPLQRQPRPARVPERRAGGDEPHWQFAPPSAAPVAAGGTAAVAAR